MDTQSTRKSIAQWYSFLGRCCRVAELIPERLAERRQAAGISQAELARRVGIGQSSANRLESGGTRNPRQIVEIARALGTTPEYLTGETDDPAPGVAPPPPVPQDEDDEIVEVKELDLAFGMGGGSYLDLPVKPKARKFTRDWLRLFTQSPPNRLFIARGIGDSMSPTIMNADIVIIDTADNRVRMADQIWAIAYGETGMIKRLRPMPDGAVKILSDNGNVPPETAYDGEIHVVGKVVAVVRRMAGA